MKKSCFLLALVSLLTISGCSNPNKEPTYDVVANFENWHPDFSTITLSYGFGRIDRNETSKFVNSGTYSALVQPQGDPARRDIPPTFYFQLRSKNHNFNKGNLKKYEKMTCSWYNEMDYDVPVKIGFVTKIETVYNIKKSAPTTYILKANSWNHIEYDIDINILNMYFNVEEAPGLYFQFGHQEVLDISFAPRLYLDDVLFHHANELREVEQSINLKENEICDFEDENQKIFMSVRETSTDAISFDIVSEDGDVKPTSGNKMLKVTSHANQSWVNWTHLIFSETYIKATPMGSLNLEEVENQMWAFCYDIRVDGLQSKTDQFVAPTFFTTGGRDELYIGGMERRAIEDEWKTVKLIFNKEYVFDGGVSRTISIDYLTRVGEFHFSIPDELYEYTLYIDNMRLEKVETN